jgi:aspartokinase/homoserine dehydrogenase 1
MIVAAYLQSIGLPAQYLDARQIVATDKQFTKARVNFDVTNRQTAEYFAQRPGTLQVITGFIGSARGGLTTTLGRGGSDYTAAIIGAALNAEAIEIWTDVNGVLTADPRKVRKAFSIPTMTYAEAMEMSHFGAKVIYPPTIQPALRKRIPLYIKNTFEPEHPGTFISDAPSQNARAVQGISSISQVALLTMQGPALFGVPGTAAAMLTSLAQAGVNIILITQGSSEHSISFAVQPSDAKIAEKALLKAFEQQFKEGMFSPLKVETELSIVAIIGENMRHMPGIAGRLFQALGNNGINCVAIAQGSSELNVSVVIERHDETKALNALHQAFFLSDTHELNLFMVGVGLVGKALLKQIHEQAAFLKDEQQIEVKIAGLSNSRRMLFDADGIDINNWKNLLGEASTAADMDAFVHQMVDLNLPNAVFIDCTSSADVAKHYAPILEESIAISTPNKLAASGPLVDYKQLKAISVKRGVPFGFETNVGAGLPVLTTLSDLRQSGDRILSIEGVLSGTLSYIFNSFDGSKPFSAVVKEAQQLGLTEPDPRDDLNGADVSRKLLILARESGLQAEATDIVLEPFIPADCMDAASVDEFFDKLKSHDVHFARLLHEALSRHEKLRVVASLRHGVARIGLESVPPSHPFYTLDGSDNMIVFTSQRYHKRPLVVRGPGAGDEVTAAGIFAEVLRIGNQLFD